MNNKKFIVGILAIAILLISGCSLKDKVDETQSTQDCDSYEMPMTDAQIEGCTCPEGLTKFRRFDGAYCTTDSQTPCISHNDCSGAEQCISDDGEDWYCTGRFAGCYFYDPENPDQEICMD